jgi:probable rRNA maturation factor
MATARLNASVATPDGPAPAARGLGAWLVRIAPARARGDLSIAIVSDRRMRTLNRVYRGHDSATDVLSFAPESQEPPGSRARNKGPRFFGEIVIAKGVAARQARQAGHSPQTEFKILALHGLLHLLGYDHEVDDGQMARVETRLRRKAGLPESR